MTWFITGMSRHDELLTFKLSSINHTTGSYFSD